MICVLVFFVITPMVILYTVGYRWDIKLGFYKTGGFYISSPVSGSKIFINNIEEKETNILQDGFFIKGFKPGKYLILVMKDGYWPWIKNLYINEEMVTEASALIIPKDPEGEIILRENHSPAEESVYDEILSELKKISQPKKISSQETATTHEETESQYLKISSDKKERLLWDPEKNKLWLEWLGNKESLPYFFCDGKICNEKILVYSPEFPIKSVDFYPDTKSAGIVSVKNGVYAIEFDGRDIRNIQQIYKGKDPISLVYKKEKAVYILDDKNLIKINLE